MGNNKIKLVGVGVIGFLLIGFFIVRQSQLNDSNYKATKTIDPDTGETIISDNNIAENSGDDEYITLQGSDKLYNAMSAQQFVLLRDLIGQYARTHVSIDVQFVKVLPDSVKINDSETQASFQLKITAPETILDAEIYIYRLDAVRLVIKNAPKPGQTYDTGYVYVSNTDDEQEEYGGDGAPPEESGE